MRRRPTLMIGPGALASDVEANERIGALCADYSKLCARLGIPYLEICRLVAASSVWQREALAGDGAHPNRLGYSLVADAVSNWRAWRDWVEALG